MERSAIFIANKGKEDLEMENSKTKQGNESQGQKAPLNLVDSTKKPGDTRGSQSGAATATARSFYDQAKETAGQAYDAVTEKAAGKLDEQRSSLSGGLTAVADSVRQVSSNLGSSETDSGLAEAAAKYTDSAARTIQNVAGYFENKDVRSMARDVESFARRNPAIFIGAAFGLGLVVARFLKSTPPETRTTSAGRDFASAELEGQSANRPAATPTRISDDPADFTARPQ